MLKFIKERLLTPYCLCDKLTDLVAKLLVVFLCAATVIVYNQSYYGGEDIEYPLTGNFEDYDPYVQQFDAYMKGRVSFDYTPDEEFMQLDNPYDPQEREEETFLYDRSYYNGKYYSYFGNAPIFTMIYPYYFIMGRIPSQGVIQTVYMTLFAIFFPILVMNLAKKVSSRVTPLLAMLVTYTAYISSLNLLIGRGDAPFYYIAVTSAMAFLVMFGYFLFKGVSSDRFRNRCMYFIAAGMAYALCFHSRVNVAFGAVFFIIPVVIFGIILKKRKITKFRILVELCSLGLFVIIGMGASLAYNYVRFDNLFEFGATYQLTVADVSTYSLDITEFGKAVYCYFIEPVHRSMIDDKLIFTDQVDFTMNRYLYVDSYFGIMSVPFMLFVPAVAFVCVRKPENKALNITLIAATCGTVITAWIDFCLGGLIFRYLGDISVILAVIAAICACTCVDGICALRNEKVRIILYAAMVTLLVVFLYRGFEITLVDNYNLMELS